MSFLKKIAQKLISAAKTVVKTVLRVVATVIFTVIDIARVIINTIRFFGRTIFRIWLIVWIISILRAFDVPEALIAMIIALIVSWTGEESALLELIAWLIAGGGYAGWRAFQMVAYDELLNNIGTLLF